MASITSPSRRDFLKISALTGGGLLLGFSWSAQGAEPAVVLNNTQFAGDLEFNSYLSIGTDGTITIFSPNPELGQNIMTSFPMIVAEELDADWNQVKVEQAALDTTKFDRQLTGGSGAIPHSWKRLRTAGATARFLLIAAAAQRWQVQASACSTNNGYVLHSASGRKLAYGALAEAAAQMKAPATIELKNRKDFKLIGKTVKNVENARIITGKSIFGMDLQRPGMVLSMIQRPPAFGSKIKSVNADTAKKMPGIIDVVTFKDKVAVVGRSTWEIMQARKTLQIEYEKNGTLESSADHDELFDKLLNSDKAVTRRKDGDTETAFRNASKILKREFQCPFIPHNPMEPMNFFAHVRPDGVELAGPCQTPAAAREATSKLLNIPEDKITLQLTRLGGGFGRRLKFDYVLEAAELSSIIKKPVKVIWTREDDMMGGIYRPAVRYRFEAALDSKGNLTGYKLRGVGLNLNNSTREDNFPSGAVDNLLIDSIEQISAITTGAWRAPVTNFLAFAEQSFLDEIAEVVGKDPVQFRLELLQKARTNPVGAIKYDIERMETVIRQAAEKSQWGKKPGVFQGFSVYFSHSSYVAQVCEVVLINKLPVVKKIFAVADCGEVINKGGALQQVMGGIVDGYGHAMFGKLNFKEGVPQQSNFDQYRLIRMKEIPEIEVHFVDNGIDPTGLGEPALPPTAGAFANAVFKATGSRLTRQPFMEQPLFKGLKGF